MQAVRTPRAPTIARGLAVRTEATATGKATGKAKAKAWCPARSESVGALALAAVVALSPIALPLPALAGGSSVVSEFKTSGVVFKDSVQVLQLKDPEVQGVTCVLVGWTATAHHSLTRAHSCALAGSQDLLHGLHEVHHGEAHEQRGRVFRSLAKLYRVHCQPLCRLHRRGPLCRLW